VAISTLVAPASRAFSTSSFTTLAGRSITSPAAIWLTMVSESRRMGMGAILTGFEPGGKAIHACAASQSRTFLALAESSRFFGQTT
jgi:hypothetical protein